MPVSYMITINSGGGDRRPAYSAGTAYKSKASLNERKMSTNSEPITQGNLSKVLNVGLAFNLGQRGNEITGAYTNDRLRQRRMDVGMTFAKYGIGLAINPMLGGVYMASDLGYRAIMYGIKIQKKNRESEYFREISGNSSNSGRRYKGDYL